MIAPAQIDLFGEALAFAPVVAGFDYWADVLSTPEQAALVAALQTLSFKPYEHLGYLGRRRIAAFDREAGGAGWPGFLSTLMARLADRLDLDGAAFVQVLVNEYAPGAGIGWHRDRPVYGEILGLSLLAPCVMRLRRREGAGFLRRHAPLACGSVYRLSGEARAAWEHSITPMTALRYSITFRTLAA
ncbi:alpha-ketoglutarate-dependent dioxygenase AlkB [Brevundimonas sp. G8]|uniref:alpha-ketoglutarate-dependent dioxygenase AlkB n=1 Tax=Brevundimonas sp. G8 TaxID=1350776 RepID=UPI0012F18313|nr:alpha-ketoglutarate-dependent dioxygenase AlkB [Brevundimonas sp. G8]VXB65269.1 2OG-Fe(II) oxygenase [Brevundimonas sp. G8]